MSINNPANQISRQSVVGMEGMWAKMFDPPTESPITPDNLVPTNPVPEVMAAAGYQTPPSTPHTVQRDLLHGAKLTAWDGKQILFYLFRDADNPATGGGNYPAATIRVPRGVVYHAHTHGHGPPPHTIHWHGIEPTPQNDGVGHCSMELGDYTYQWQPNFIGFYFCHCHRNTEQHFDFGLFGALLIEPPDTYFATQRNPAIPIGACRDGKFRIAANLSHPLYTGSLKNLADQNTNLLTAPDPTPDAANPWPFTTDPHAMTVPYDVEALWVVDDRDSVWSDLAPDARATYPKQGGKPGIDDNFHGNAGGGVKPGDFFAFNQYNADYWYCTGVNFNGPRGGSGTIPSDVVIPPQLMSGKSGVQVSIDAEVGQTILLRVLDAAYNDVTYYFPFPITVIAWDGRALGVPPYGFNNAYEVPAGLNPDGTHNQAGAICASVARRFDALVKVDAPFSGFADVEFLDTRNGTANSSERNVGNVTPLFDASHQTPLFTGKIPINIGYSISGKVNNFVGGLGQEGVSVTLTSGAINKTTITDNAGNFKFTGLPEGSYMVTPALAGFTFSPQNSMSAAPNSTLVFVGTQTAGLSILSGSVVSSRGGAVGIPGITVSLLNPDGTPVMRGNPSAAVTSITDNEGHYRFTGLADGSYMVKPAGVIFAGNGKPGDVAGATTAAYLFSPESITASVAGANKTVEFFRGRMLM